MQTLHIKAAPGCLFHGIFADPETYLVGLFFMHVNYYEQKEVTDW